MIVLDRVGHKVQQHLDDSLLVRHHMPLGDICYVGAELHGRPGRQGRGELDRLLDDLRHQHRLRGKRQPACLDAGDVQDLVDQPEEMPPAPQDVSHAFPLLRREGVRLQHLGKPEDGVEWRAQFVAHPRQELALRLIRPVGLARPRERFFTALALCDVLHRSLEVRDPGRVAANHPRAGPHPDDLSVEPAQPALEPIDHPLTLQQGDPLCTHLGIEVERCRFRIPRSC